MKRIVEKLKMDLKHIKQREKVAEGIASTIHTAPGMEKTPKGYKDYIEKSLIRMFDKSSEIKDIEKNLGIMEIIQRNLSGLKLNAQGGRTGAEGGGLAAMLVDESIEVANAPSASRYRCELIGMGTRIAAMSRNKFLPSRKRSRPSVIWVVLREFFLSKMLGSKRLIFSPKETNSGQFWKKSRSLFMISVSWQAARA